MDTLLDVYDKNNKEWLQFSSVTLNNIQEIETNIEKVESKREITQKTINNIKTLSQHAQGKAYVKICPRAFVAATVKHTGEYNVEVNSEYHCTLTKDQTIEYLEEQLAEQSGILANYGIQKEQLQMRLGLNFEDIQSMPDLSDMPDRIITEKGIAFKQGMFYEILEIEADTSYVKHKKRISRLEQKTQCIHNVFNNRKK